MTGPTPSEAEDLLTGLLQQYSPSTHEQAAVRYLVTWACAHGLNAEIDGAGNAVITVGAGEHTVLLLGHIDTVPASCSGSTQVHPLAPEPSRTAGA